jgi:hypothetical protein
MLDRLMVPKQRGVKAIILLPFSFFGRLIPWRHFGTGAPLTKVQR